MTARDLETRSRTLLAPLRAPVPVPAPPLETEERERSLIELGDWIRAVPQQRAAHRARRRIRGWVLALPVAASVLLAMGGVAYLSAPALEAPPPVASDTAGATLVAGSLRTEQGVALVPGQRFAEAGVLRTPRDQSALVLTRAGVQLTVAPDSMAGVPSAHQEQRFVLERGQLSLDVPPLPAGQLLSVVTADATVVVHGTRFSVTYDDEATPATCVRVTEGRVSVTRGDRVEMLNAGDASGCGEVAPPPPKPAEPEPSVFPSRPPPSTLAQQNRLWQRALAAEQAGRREAAARDLERLLAQYPGSPFRAEAQRALARVRAPQQDP